MSNDTDYSLRFRHKSKKYLEKVRQYAVEKKERWDTFELTGRDMKVLMKRVGAKKPNEVVSWGFEFGTMVRDGSDYCLPATAWANENLRNIHISREEGELADLLLKFRELEIEGEFTDEYGWGSISVWKCYEGQGKRYEE